MSDEKRLAHQDATDDLLDALFEGVRRAKDEARRTAEFSAHALEFAREVFDHREEYNRALTTLQRIEDENLHELFFREVESAYRAETTRVTQASHRASLLTAWIQVLLDAVMRVDATLARADALRAAGPPTEEDRAYRDATRHRAATRWQGA